MRITRVSVTVVEVPQLPPLAPYRSHIRASSTTQSAIVRVGQSTITGNGTGWQALNGGQVQSYGNNNVGGNTTDGTASTTLALE